MRNKLNIGWNCLRNEEKVIKQKQKKNEGNRYKRRGLKEWKLNRENEN